MPTLPPAIVTATATPVKTYILTIDRAKFRPEALRGLGGEVVYVADLASVAAVKPPSHIVSILSEKLGVPHVPEDGVITTLTPNTEKRPLGKGKGNGSKQPPQTTPWSVEYINAPDVWPTGITGFFDVNGDGDSEIEVAIIDTGVDKDHPDPAGNIKWGIAVWGGKISTKFNDQNGHRTHVTGTVAAPNNEIGVVGVAPTLETYMIKALGA